jgi:hypothetical protein
MKTNSLIVSLSACRHFAVSARSKLPKTTSLQREMCEDLTNIVSEIDEMLTELEAGEPIFVDFAFDEHFEPILATAGRFDSDIRCNCEDRPCCGH